MDRPPPETCLDTVRVYDGRPVKLDLDTVALAEGGQRRREIIRHPGAVIIVPLTADGGLVLLRQWRYCAGGELIELPAGTLDKDAESTLACAQRELAEEAGLAAGRWRELGSFFTTPGFTTEVIWAFAAEDLSPAEGFERDEDERIEVFEASLAEALAMARDGRIRDAKTIAALFLATGRGDEA
jgi:ADP-ribose pyrophosphatase